VRVRAARDDDGDFAAFIGFWRELGLEQAHPDRAKWSAQLCPTTIYLVDADDRPAAYALTFALGARGDVRQIAVAPSDRRRGLGRELMRVVAARLRAAGCTDWRLEVRADNAPAIALYRAAGMRVLRSVHAVKLTRAQLERFAATATTQVVELARDDEAAVETQLDLGRGEIARWRRSHGDAPFGRVGTTGLVHVWRDFMPERALVFPLRAPDAEVTAALVAFALAHTDKPELEVYVERPEVHAALVAIGAELLEHQYEMGGELPQQ
jgi:GNAT superfamily N-acetyltransferase